MQQEIQNFFSRFEEAISTANSDAFADLYAESFQFAGTNGVQVVARDSFLPMIPRMKAHYLSMGLVERKITAVHTQTLDERYLLAKVTWTMGVEHPTGRKHVEIVATYLLARGTSGALRIVFQIDHQDLATVLKSTLAT